MNKKVNNLKQVKLKLSDIRIDPTVEKLEMALSGVMIDIQSHPDWNDIGAHRVFVNK